MAESPVGKLDESRIDPFNARIVIRTPAEKLELLSGLSPAEYTLLHSPDEASLVLLVSPTVASAPSDIVMSAKTMGAKRNAIATLEYVERRTTERDTAGVFNDHV